MGLREVDLRIRYNHIHTKKFNSEGWAVAELYYSFIKDLEVGKVQKCTINVSDDWGNELNDYTNWPDYRGINILFDFDTYFSLGKFDRKKMLLEAVHNGMMQIAEKEDWETDTLLDAYNKCLEKNLEYQFDVGKLKSSPNRKYKIGFWCNWDIDIFELYWVLYDKKGNELKRKKLIDKPPYEGEFIYYAKWKWLDNNRVLLEDKYKYGKNEKWEIDLELEKQTI